jgi:CheY-like chemotaxis protein
MLGEERELHRRLATRLQRALVVDPKAPAALAMSELLHELAGCQIWTAPDAARGSDLAQHIAPHLILAARRSDFDGPDFLRRLRRSDFDCRQAPAIIYSPEATAAALVAARDAGAQELLRLPVTRGELGRRLESAILRQRDWVEGVGYVGPDRRRFNCGDYGDALRRRVEHAVTPEAARIDQAIRIVRDALAAMDTDPHQALRALRAQAETLQAIAEAHGEPTLRTRAEALGRKLARASPRHLRLARIEPLVAPLLDYASSSVVARKAA